MWTFFLEHPLKGTMLYRYSLVYFLFNAVVLEQRPQHTLSYAHAQITLCLLAVSAKERHKLKNLSLSFTLVCGHSFILSAFSQNTYDLKKSWGMHWTFCTATNLSSLLRLDHTRRRRWLLYERVGSSEIFCENWELKIKWL